MQLRKVLTVCAAILAAAMWLSGLHSTHAEFRVDMEPQARPAEHESSSKVHFPVVMGGGPIPAASDLQPVGGVCSQGKHPVHFSGEAGIRDSETVEYEDWDYTCQPNETLDGVHCSGHGTPTLLDGRAVCACDEGYAGAACNIRIEPLRPPEIIIEGARESLEAGQERRLVASGRGYSTFEWRVVEGSGCLVDAATGRCSETLIGRSVVYRAPSAVREMEIARIQATPPREEGPTATVSIITVVPDDIPITGYGDSRLQPMLRATRDFMRHRCVGAAVLGVSYRGQILGVWGLGRTEGRATKISDPACGDDQSDPFYPDAALVQHDTPFRIGSISKSVTAAMARWALKKVWKQKDPSFDPTDDDIENLPLLQANEHLGELLLPPQLEDVFGGITKPPVLISDKTSYDTKGALCDDLQEYADSQWTQVQLKHLLAHRSGLQRSAPSVEADVMPNLAVLRNLSAEADFAAEHDKLVAKWGLGIVHGARVELHNQPGFPEQPVYFVPRSTLDEVLTVLAGRCLRHPLGTHRYSNTSPAFLSTIITGFMASQRYGALPGDPDSHQGSALHIFFEEMLGVATTAADGIFVTQAAGKLPGYPYREPEKRHWSKAQNTYYPQAWDTKRPHCIWTGSECSFSNWANTPASFGRINWPWQLNQVPFAYTTATRSPGTGSLAVEAPLFLKFMSKYWVGGYGVNPRIGEERNGVWNLSTSHGGALNGTRAYALQLANNSGTSWTLPPRTISGNNILDQFYPSEGEIIIARAQTGQLDIYRKDGAKLHSFPVGFHEDDRLAIGKFDHQGAGDRILIARHDTGMIDLYVFAGEQLHKAKSLWPTGGGFSPGDAFAIADFDNDIFDEILIARAQNGKIDIYEPHPTQDMLVKLHSFQAHFSEGDGFAVGDFNGNRKNEIFIARRETGVVDVYTPAGTQLKSLNAGFGEDDGFAVTDVLGHFKVEILIARHDTGVVDIYNYSANAGEYELYQTFASGYQSQDGFVAGDVDRADWNDMVVARHNTGAIYIYHKEKEDGNDGPVKVLATFDAGFDQKDGLAVGHVYGGGLDQYRCASPAGDKRSFPDGLNIFVAVNQRADKKSVEDDSYTSGTAYGLLDNFVKYGACRVNWGLVTGPNVIIGSGE